MEGEIIKRTIEGKRKEKKRDFNKGRRKYSRGAGGAGGGRAVIALPDLTLFLRDDGWFSSYSVQSIK